MSKKIVVINGSPWKAGNSFAMTDAFIKAAQEKGRSVTRFDAALANVGGAMLAKPAIKQVSLAALMMISIGLPPQF